MDELQNPSAEATETVAAPAIELEDTAFEVAQFIDTPIDEIPAQMEASGAPVLPTDVGDLRPLTDVLDSTCEPLEGTQF